MRIIIAVLCAIILIFGLYIRFNWDKYKMKSKCLMYEQFVETSINGSVKRKYQDKNHGLKEKVQINDLVISVFLDSSGFYDFVQPGDSVVKDVGVGLIEIYRNDSSMKQFTIDFGCDDYDFD